MTPEYLTYEKRAYGNDHDRYDWSYSKLRAPVRPEGVADVTAFIVVPLEFFPLNPSGKPFKHPGAMVTPYPDLRHFSTRDYGNRVGIYRILEALEAEGLKAVIPMNGEVLSRCAPLVERIKAGGHEIAAHGVSTDHIHYDGLSKEEESAYIEKTLELFGAVGITPTTWMSPARNESYNTPDLLTRAGFKVCLDWEMDQVPVAMKTETGPLTCLPNHGELNDFNLMHTKRQSEDEWREQILESAAFLASEAKTTGARVFGFTLTPYISGLPFRVRALREILAGLKEKGGVEVKTASQIASAWGDTI